MATRLYFPADTAAANTPAFDAIWSYNSEAVRRRLANVKGSSAITIGTQVGPWTAASDFALDRQYLSDPMAAGTVFTSGTHNVKLQLMVREYNNGDNVDRIILVVKVVSNDGTTVRATIKGATSSSQAEFINNATHRNKSFPASNLSGSYTTVAGDRLLVEIGYQVGTGSGTSPEASAKWGENATDLPENETQTTDGAGWIEFSNTITFSGGNQELDFTAGTYAVTGNATGLRWNRLIPITAGSYSVSGNNVTLSKGYKLTVEAGVYSTSGNNATLKRTYILSANAGSYSHAGENPSITKGFRIQPQAGSYSVSGNDVTFKYNRVLGVTAGVYSTTGQNASLKYGRRLDVLAGSYSTSGETVQLKKGWKLPTTLGIYSYVGNDVDLTVGGAGNNYELDISAGVYSVVGNSVTLTHTRVLTADAGVYTTTGNDVTLTKTSVSRAKIIDKILYKGFNWRYLD